MLARGKLTFFSCVLKVEYHNNVMIVRYFHKTNNTSANIITFRKYSQQIIYLVSWSSGVPAAGGGSYQHAQGCSVGPLQSFIHAVRQRWRGELVSTSHQCLMLMNSINSAKNTKYKYEFGEKSFFLWGLLECRACLLVVPLLALLK